MVKKKYVCNEKKDRINKENIRWNYGHRLQLSSKIYKDGICLNGWLIFTMCLCILFFSSFMFTTKKKLIQTSFEMCSIQSTYQPISRAVSLVLPHCTLDSGFQVWYLFGFKIQSILISYFIFFVVVIWPILICALYLFISTRWMNPC